MKLSFALLSILVIIVSIAIIGVVLRGSGRGGGSSAGSGNGDWGKRPRVGYDPSSGFIAVVNELLRVSRQRISRLEFLSNKLDDVEMADTVARINRIAAAILQTLNRNPEKVNDVRFFLDYYLPVLTTLIEDYDNLGSNVSEEASANTKSNLSGLLRDVETAFQKQLDALASDKIIDIDAEIKVFAKSLREDGLVIDDRDSQNDEAPISPVKQHE